MFISNIGDVYINPTFSRFHRVRQSALLRPMLHEARLSLTDLILPVFVEEGSVEKTEIRSLPGVYRIPEAMLEAEIKAIRADGIRAVMLFGISRHKDSTGSDSLKSDGLLARMIKRSKDACPDIAIIADTCFCEYTDHGHCGVIDENGVVNDETIRNLALQGVVAAAAGASMVAPSAMMDGQVQAIRASLDDAGYQQLPIMAYSSKFASSFYGPFRSAVDCELKGDRKAYQISPCNGREAIREALVDEDEGADILMVKPAMPYLDVVAQLRGTTRLPLAAYQVSGEYAMIEFAARSGAIDRVSAVRESLHCFKRAGADLIITYFARYIAREGLELR